MTADTYAAIVLFALCLAPIVVVETAIAITEAIRRRRERKEIYKPLKH